MANVGLKLSAHFQGQRNPFDRLTNKKETEFSFTEWQLVLDLAVPNKSRPDLPFLLFYIFIYTNNATLGGSSKAFIDYLAASHRHLGVFVIIIIIIIGFGLCIFFVFFC